MKQNKRFNKNDSQEKQIRCQCGGPAKLCSQKNYPFGKKSKAVVSEFYKCKLCQIKTFTSRNAKGGRK